MKNITQMFCYIAQKVFLQTYKKAYFVGRGIQNSEKHQKPISYTVLQTYKLN